MYCILILPFVLITIIAHLLDGFISFCDSYVEDVKNWIINRYKPDVDIMNYEEIVKECLSMIDGFDGSDSDYLHLLGEMVDECRIRIETKKMEMEDDI